jgi:hypothetical protein
VVDAIDGIGVMKAGAGADGGRGLALIQGRLEDNITLVDGELIRETQWQPAVQRAVKVESAETGQTESRVLRARTTGLKHGGRLIRTQEVVIRTLTRHKEPRCTTLATPIIRRTIGASPRAALQLRGGGAGEHHRPVQSPTTRDGAILEYCYDAHGNRLSRSEVC